MKMSAAPAKTQMAVANGAVEATVIPANRPSLQLTHLKWPLSFEGGHFRIIQSLYTRGYFLPRS